MRDDFVNGRHMRGDFSNMRQKRNMFSNGPDRQKRNTFSNGPGWQKRNAYFNRACRQKRNKFFNGWTGLLKKGRRKVLCVSPSRQNQNEFFQTVAAHKRIIMHLIYASPNANVPMECVFQFLLQDYEQNSNDFFY